MPAPALAADLRHVAEAWPTLPEAVRAGILAMVKAAAWRNYTAVGGLCSAIFCPQDAAKWDARGGQPIDPDDLDAAIARLQEIAGEDRGRVSWQARQALADIERALTPAT